MKRLCLLALLLTSCGSDPGQRPGEGQGGQPQLPPLDLASLHGQSTEAVIASLIPALARAPGHQNRAALARALDEHWKINCETNCSIERK